MPGCRTGSLSAVPVLTYNLAPDGNNIATWSLQLSVCHNHNSQKCARVGPTVVQYNIRCFKSCFFAVIIFDNPRIEQVFTPHIWKIMYTWRWSYHSETWSVRHPTTTKFGTTYMIRYLSFCKNYSYMLCYNTTTQYKFVGSKIMDIVFTLNSEFYIRAYNLVL